jgi:hypothetical protein
MDKLYYYNDKPCVRVIDFALSNLSDSDIIESAINYARTNNIDTILFDSKDWIIDRAILYYSGVTFIVDGVKLKQANGVFDNVFRSEGFIVDKNNPYNYPVDVKPIENFKILGKNNAVIEGTDVEAKILNYETGEHCEPIGDRWGWRGISLYFTCCKNFEFSGFTIRKTRTWAISAERCKYAKFSDITVYSTCVNGDGLNLRNGCSYIDISNFHGITFDDLIALNNASIYNTYPVKTWKTYLYPTDASNVLMTNETIEDQAIHNVIIDNASGNSAIAFLARNGTKIHDIKVTNVTDKFEDCERLNIADILGAYYTTGYGEVSSEICLYNFYIENIECNYCKSAVLFNDRVKNLTIKNVIQKEKEGVVLTACDEDEINIIDCKAVSNIIRNSSKVWKNPNLKR